MMFSVVYFDLLIYVQTYKKKKKKKKTSFIQCGSVFFFFLFRHYSDIPIHEEKCCCEKTEV